MEQPQWLKTVKKISEKPSVYLNQEDKIIGDEVVVLCKEVSENLEILFAQFKTDKEFEYLLEHLQGILHEFNEEMGFRFDEKDITAEPQILSIYDSVSEFVNSALLQKIISADEAEMIRTEMNSFDKSRDAIEKIDKETHAINPQVFSNFEHTEEHRLTFLSQMDLYTRMTDEIFDEYHAAVAINPTRNLTENLQTLAQRIKAAWEHLDGRDAQNVVYTDFIKILNHIRDNIEKLFVAHEIDKDTYEELRLSIESIFSTQKQIEYHQEVPVELNESTPKISELGTKSESLSKSIEIFLQEYEINRSQGDYYPVIQKIKTAFNEIFEIWYNLDTSERLDGIPLVSDAMTFTKKAYQTVKNNPDIDPKECTGLEHLVETAAHDLMHQANNPNFDGE